MSLIRGIHQGAKVLLSHFHHLNKHQTPFQYDWSSPKTHEDMRKVANLEDWQVDILSKLVPLIQKNS